MTHQGLAAGRTTYFPQLAGWGRYQPKWLRADLIAGVNLAAYLMPAGLADSSVPNLPPQAGLYACLFSGLIFWVFCSSRHTAMTITSAISVLVGASLGDLAGLLGVLGSGLLRGVLIGAAISLVQLLRRASRHTWLFSGAFPGGADL